MVRSGVSWNVVHLTSAHALFHNRLLEGSKLFEVMICSTYYMSSAHSHLLKKKTKSSFISGIKLSIFRFTFRKKKSLKGKGKKAGRIAWKRPADDLLDHSYKLVSEEFRTMHLFWIKYES